MKGWMKVLFTVGVVGCVVVILFGWYAGIKNKLVTLDEGVKSAWSQVENQLQRRYDLIPNLVETVKGYAKHEEQVLTEVTNARSRVGGAQTPSDKMEANNQLTSALSRLLVVVERYPDLKANQNFLALQDELAGTENRISVERKRYNEAAQVFNAAIRKIPNVWFAGSFKKATYFESAKEAKDAPKVKF
jgi:LemA protein